PLGARQAKVLGEHWAALGVRIDRVYVGPKQRHHQTEQAVASIYQARGLFWPVPESLPELDEHQGFEVMQHILPDRNHSLPSRLRQAQATIRSLSLSKATDWGRG
ncbi:MAG: hypothetical protein GY796_25955, partial [Chloroflexi bacterium]|nr:hypothetical protein [Chloroflexota bacterium]